MPRRNSTYEASVASDDLSDYDVISSGGLRSLESSVDDLALGTRTTDGVSEPPPAQAAKEKFATATLSAEDVQTYVKKTLERTVVSGRSEVWERRTVRVYVDGAFDIFHAGHALQLRQAKLSFPSVRLLVGVLPDECNADGPTPTCPHIERCELLRHCRWVDEVIPDAPPVLDEQFLLRHRIDFVAVEEGISLDPACDKVRVKGYEYLRELGKVIPTRRTFGLVPPLPIHAVHPPTPVPPPAVPSGLPIPAEPSLDHEAAHRTPRSPLQMFEEGPPLDIYGIGI